MVNTTGRFQPVATASVQKIRINSSEFQATRSLSNRTRHRRVDLDLVVRTEIAAQVLWFVSFCVFQPGTPTESLPVKGPLPANGGPAVTSSLSNFVDAVAATDDVSSQLVNLVGQSGRLVVGAKRAVGLDAEVVKGCKEEAGSDELLHGECFY